MAEATAKPRKSAGRPPSYTREVADKVCDMLAAGKGRRAICAMEGMPSWATLYQWSTGDCKVAAADGFPARYATARSVYLEHLAEDILEISDDSSRDEIETEDGTSVNHEVIQRSRLRVDSRKWLLSKLRPDKYGDRIAAELSGPAGGPIAHSITVEMVPVVAAGAAQRVIEAQASESEEE